MALKPLLQKFATLKDTKDRLTDLVNKYTKPAISNGQNAVTLDGGNQFAGGDMVVDLDKKNGAVPGTASITRDPGAVQCAAADVTALATALNAEDWDFDGDGKNDIVFSATVGDLGKLTVTTVARGADQEVTIKAATDNGYGIGNQEDVKKTGSENASWDESKVTAHFGDGFWYITGWEPQ